jgi:predicted 2-oxoglutarate/Fe(II)-dependent dioxygenase YbiX
MNYSINKFFDKNECTEIINFAEKNGVRYSYDKNKYSWDCKRLPESSFTENLVSRLIHKYSEGSFNLWTSLNNFNIVNHNVSLTKYYDGRYIDLHVDRDSKFTTVIVLSENFEDGRFVISDKFKLTNETSNVVTELGSISPSSIDYAKKIHLEMGECITIDGTKTYHGVLPVFKGVRYALTLWITDEKIKFIKPAKKSLF